MYVENLKLYFVKILRRLRLLDKLNFNLRKNINGENVIIPFINGIGLTNYVIENDWLDILIEFFVKGKSGTFVDVGVNIGQTLLRLKTINPEIKYLGFEPNSTCTSYSQSLANLNKFNNLIIQNVALSSKVNNLILEKSYNVDSRASLVSELRPNFFTEKECILAIDYQSFYLDEEISFVKIDVEGAEYEVLEGMKNALIRHKPIITCEVLDSFSLEQLSFTQARASNVCNLLHSIDYSIIQLNTNKNRIVSFKKIDAIEIIQWTSKSYALNDYIFYPIAKETYVLENLSKIILK